MKLKVNEEARKVVLRDIRVQSAICTATGKGHSTVLRWLYKADADKLSQKVVSDIISRETGLNIVDYAVAAH
jgi:hypothetical protein